MTRIYDGNRQVILDNDSDFSDVGILFPLQPIFKEETADNSKLIVDGDLNSVRVVDKQA